MLLELETTPEGRRTSFEKQRAVLVERHDHDGPEECPARDAFVKDGSGGAVPITVTATATDDQHNGCIHTVAAGDAAGEERELLEACRWCNERRSAAAYARGRGRGRGTIAAAATTATEEPAATTAAA